MNLGDFFDTRRTGEGFEEIPSTTEQDAARAFYSNLMSGAISAPTLQVAGMSDAEKQGINLLSQYLGTSESPERAGALNYLTGILDQNIDVTQLPEIQALLSTIKTQTGDLVNSALRRTQLGGIGNSGPQGSAVGRELAKGETSMVAAFAPYLSQLRSNKLTAAQLINSLVSGQEGTILNKLNAATTVGALPRTLEQAQNSAEFQKLMTDLQNKYNAAGNLLSEQRYMYDPGVQSPSIFQDILGIANAGANLYGAYALGGLGGGVGGLSNMPGNLIH